VVLSPSGQEVHIEHIQPDSSVRPCAVICTFCTDPTQLGLPVHSVHYGGFVLYAAP